MDKPPTMPLATNHSLLMVELAQVGGCESSFELVMISLTLPLWTAITLYLVLLLIHYLRRLQSFSLYDKCTPRNAHFRYDFHIVVGKHSVNFSRLEHNLIVDLLDNQMVSTMTIQIPGQTVFNEQQIFMYRHTRPNTRCVSFTVYRRQPIKDVKCLRVAHSCSNQDSRIYVYGVDLYDETNGEKKMFPILSVVKYRGTQWALVTTFEPKPDVNFKKLGVDCHDPFGYSIWPTHLETLTILLFIWCASFCFGHLITVREISDSIPLHALTLLFIVAISAAGVSALYLGIIKTHIVDGHYDSSWWHLGQQLYLLTAIVVSVGFWILALNQAKQCRRESLSWLISTALCSLILTALVIFIWLVAGCKRSSSDRALKAITDATLAKTNSKETIQFATDPSPSFCSALLASQQAKARRGHANAPKTGKSASKTAAKSNDHKNQKKMKRSDERATAQQEDGGSQRPEQPKEDTETLDTAFGNDSKYIKARNRNSISQYV